MADTALAETIVKMMRTQLAECEEMIALGVAPPGTAEHVDMIRTLLATFAARKPPDLPRIQVLAKDYEAHVEFHKLQMGDARGILEGHTSGAYPRYP